MNNYIEHVRIKRRAALLLAVVLGLFLILSSLIGAGLEPSVDGQITTTATELPAHSN